MRMAKVGLLFETEPMQRRWQFGLNVFQLYIEEILAHAGIPYTAFHRLEELEQYDIVIAGMVRDGQETAEALWRFANEGGVLIGYRGLNKLAARLGCQREQVTGAGYAHMAASPYPSEPMRYAEAEAWVLEESGGMEATAVGLLHEARPDGAAAGPVLLSFRTGQGSIHRWAVDVPVLIAQMQQGSSPVLDDGVPAKDGSGAVDEGIHKADDRFEMDWELDRGATGTGLLYFNHPYADYWREAIIGQLLQAAAEHGLTLPFIDLWPDGVDNVALLSLDSDLNDNAAAAAALDLLEQLSVRSTWCIIEPGLSEDTYARAKRAGHELAMHYNAHERDGGEWSRDAFREQNEWVKLATGEADIVSNKNHFTRYEGWGELFQWCEAFGIQADQTRGPSKRGNIGFPFGTCQPYRPIAWFDEENRLYDVLEIGFLTMDLNYPSLADDSVITPFLERAQRVRGVAHFLFHHYHIHHQPSVHEAAGKVVREAKACGFQFWTSREINDWERSRRAMKLQMDTIDAIELVGASAEHDAVIWMPVSKDAGAEAAELRYGVPCVRKVISACA